MKKKHSIFTLIPCSFLYLSLIPASYAKSLELNVETPPALHGIRLMDDFDAYKELFCSPSFIQPTKPTKRRICTTENSVSVSIEITRKGKIVSVMSYESDLLETLVNLEAVEAVCDVNNSVDASQFNCGIFKIHWINLQTRSQEYGLEICDPKYCVTSSTKD